jgi:Spy/CpxP family protein refolding chaperone
MKQIFSILILLFALGSSVALQAQDGGRFPLLRERIAQAKLREIQKTMNLGESTFARFRPIYLKYEQEIANIDFRKQVRLMRVNADSLSSEEAEQLVLSQLEAAKRLITIRETYYKEFRTVLTPQQIIKLYQAEAEIRRKVMQELKNRFGNRFGLPGD